MADDGELKGEDVGIELCEGAKLDDDVTALEGRLLCMLLCEELAAWMLVEDDPLV